MQMIVVSDEYAAQKFTDKDEDRDDMEHGG